jgi:hypothetical protein
MLECGRLLIRDAESADSRAILDATTDRTLGSARRVRLRSWLPIWRILEVREADDAPLVFTVERIFSLARRFIVRDADGRSLGMLIGSMIVSPAGHLISFRDSESTMRDIDGRALARVSRTLAGTEIDFAVATDPFIRMLLLAAVLRS